MSDSLSSEDINTHEELLSFQLRGRLALIDFKLIWKVMQELKWRHSSSNYISPSGENLGSAKVAMETLDACALSCLELRSRFSNTNHHMNVNTNTNTNTNGNMSSHIEIGSAVFGDDHATTTRQMEMHKKWRKDLLTGVFYKCKELEKPLPCFFFDDKDPEEEEEDDDENDGDKEKDKMNTPVVATRTRTFSVRKAKAALTANETGTAEYLVNKTKKVSKKDRDAAAASADHHVTISKDDDDIDDANGDDTKLTEHKNITPTAGKGSREKLKWPNPSDCVKRNRDKNKNRYKGERKKSPSMEEEEWRSHFLKKHFIEWKFLLGTNHSLLLHGFGSKQALMNDFAKQLRQHGDVLTIKGFDPDVSIGQILDIMVQLFLNGVEPSSASASTQLVDCHGHGSYDDDGVFDIDAVQSSPSLMSNVSKRAKSIGQALGARHTKPIYLLIHNIDGVSMINDGVQRALALLVANSTVSTNGVFDRTTSNGRVIRLVASLDHVDSPIVLWDVETLTNFSWIWKNVDTYAPYYDEVKQSITGEARKMKMKQLQVLDFTYMQKVLKSLAPKHAKILKVLADMQISIGKGDHRYVSYKDWKSNCFDKMIVRGEGEMRSILNELCDHGMIRLSNDNQREYICIPTSTGKVEEILQRLS